MSGKPKHTYTVRVSIQGIDVLYRDFTARTARAAFEQAVGAIRKETAVDGIRHELWRV